MSANITVRTSQDREFLKNKSVYALPDNPSDKGFSASQLKAKIGDPNLILFDWFQTLAQQTFDGFKEYDEFIDATVHTAADVYFNGKLDKIDAADIVYGNNGSKEPTSYGINAAVTGSAIPIRDLSGQLEVPLVPTEDEHATSKDYVDYLFGIVNAKASGKKAAFTLSKLTNPAFDSSSDSITVSSFTDANGDTITWEDVQVGDDIYVVETLVPDRWVQSIDSVNHTMTLYQLETQKDDLTVFYTKTESDQRYLQASKFVKLTQAQYDALGSKDANTFYFIEE